MCSLGLWDPRHTVVTISKNLYPHAVILLKYHKISFNNLLTFHISTLWHKITHLTLKLIVTVVIFTVVTTKWFLSSYSKLQSDTHWPKPFSSTACKTQRLIFLTSARRSKRPNSSLSVRTNSWADMVMEREVKPFISANRILRQEHIYVHFMNHPRGINVLEGSTAQEAVCTWRLCIDECRSYGTVEEVIHHP